MRFSFVSRYPFLKINQDFRTTIGGLIPLALSGGPLWEGMAWCMIYGLAVATMLTLLVIPALFAIFVEVLKVPPVNMVKEIAG